MRIALEDCPMVVSNRLKFLHSKYNDVKVVLGTHKGNIACLYAIYIDWQGERHEKIIGTF